MGCSPSQAKKDLIELNKLKQLSNNLTAKQTHFVLGTWPLLRTDTEDCGRIMVKRLFVLYPNLKASFHKTFTLNNYPRERWSELIAHHGFIVIRILGDAVESMDDTKPLSNMLADVGIMHHNWGIPAESFECLWPALDFMLEDKLKYSYSSEVHDAWLAVFHFVVDKMVRAMKEKETRQSVKTLSSKGSIDLPSKQTLKIIRGYSKKLKW